MFKLAMIQMRVAPGEKSVNLTHASVLLDQAAAQGASVAMLPETMDLGWTHPAAADEAEPIPGGEPAKMLQESAARHRMFICAGLTERAGSVVYNTAVLCGPDGEILLRHRKINELDIAHDCYALGDGLSVVRTSIGCMGVMICADAFAPGQVLSRSLAMMGADIILSPCAWAVPADHDQVREPYGKLWRNHYCPVARDFGIWIAGVSNVGPILAGPWAGRKCIGCSLLVGPGGHVALQGPYGENAEAILMAEVETAPRSRPGGGR